MYFLRFALRHVSFLRKGKGKSDAFSRFTDEHDLYRLLAERESSGTYLRRGVMVSLIL
jgi:hypothetical protein